MALVRGNEIPTIDVALVTITTKNAGGTVDKEYAIDTSSKIAVAPIVNTQEAIQLMIKGVLKAQKRKKVTITGHTITLTDNVFIPEVVKILQGGTVTMGIGADAAKVVKYEPPVAGVEYTPSIFELCAYSAIYNAAGLVTGYEKITYPNCTGEPIGINAEDNVFRVSEYVIVSSPDTNEVPYTIDYVAALPAIT